MAENVRGGAGRKDEVGRSGIYPATGPYPDGDAPIITPGEINSGATGEAQQDDDPRTINRESGLDSETGKPENDSLGG
jgi:hypothetical protein